jgi:hypothetical protein
LQLFAYLFFSRYLLVYCPCVYIVRVSCSILSGTPSLGILLLKSEVSVSPLICPFPCLFPHLMWITWSIQHVTVWKRWMCNCVKYSQSFCWVCKNYSQYRNELFWSFVDWTVVHPQIDQLFMISGDFLRASCIIHNLYSSSKCPLSFLFGLTFL